MMPLESYTANVCTNCVIVGFNGDYSGVSEDDPAPLNQLEPTAHLVDVSDESHFSWHACDGCGAIAGDRYEVTVFVEERV